jgi:hypothetical protein
MARRSGQHRSCSVQVAERRRLATSWASERESHPGQAAASGAAGETGRQYPGIARNLRRDHGSSQATFAGGVEEEPDGSSPDGRGVDSDGRKWRGRKGEGTTQERLRLGTDQLLSRMRWLAACPLTALWAAWSRARFASSAVNLPTCSPVLKVV